MGRGDGTAGRDGLPGVRTPGQRRPGLHGLLSYRHAVSGAGHTQSGVSAGQPRGPGSVTGAGGSSGDPLGVFVDAVAYQPAWLVRTGQRAGLRDRAVWTGVFAGDVPRLAVL